MKFLLTFTSIYFILLLFKSTLAGDDSNPLKCEWGHKDGESGWKCNNNGFYANEMDMYDAYGNGGFTSFKKEEPESVKDKGGWPIDLKNVKQHILENINQNREIHRAPVLTEDSSLRSQAQGIANILAKSGSENDPSVSKENGESRACVDKNEINNVVKKWYDQRNSYKYDTPEDNKENGTSDFSQMVWGGSKSIGCGVANKDSTYCIVCKYSPPGNVDGQYGQNVRKDYDTVIFKFGN